MCYIHYDLMLLCFFVLFAFCFCFLFLFLFLLYFGFQRNDILFAHFPIDSKMSYALYINSNVVQIFLNLKKKKIILFVSLSCALAWNWTLFLFYVRKKNSYINSNKHIIGNMKTVCWQESYG